MKTFLALAVAMLALIAIAIVLQVADAPAPATPPAPVARPAPLVANDKTVLVRGWNATELDRIMLDFSKLYGVPPAFVVAPHATVADVLTVTFPHDIEPALYFYLVNYLQYPREFDLRGRNIAVLGRTTLDDTFALPPGVHGKRAFVYVPAADQNFDRVYMFVVSMGVYEHALGEGTAWTRVDADRMPRDVRALIDAR